jgi:hypothetical protein
LEKRELLPGDSMWLDMTVVTAPVHSRRDVSCILSTDLPEDSNWTYRLRFEIFPDARVVPDRIELGTFSAAKVGSDGRLEVWASPGREAFLEVFTQPNHQDHPPPVVTQTPEGCVASLGERSEVDTLANGVRRERFRLVVGLKDGVSSAGTFVKPLNLSVGGGAGASALVVWTVRALVNCEPPQIHFGSVALGDPPTKRRLIIRSSDGRPFRVLSVDQSELLKVDQPAGDTFPSPPEKVQSLGLVFEIREGSSRFLAGSVRIRTDREDCPCVFVPWSAFLRERQRKSSAL